MLIGREKELEMLKLCYESDESQFVAVYGRKRVGKTFLVREAFAGKIEFQHAGLAKGGQSIQLEAFAKSLIEQGERRPRQNRETSFRCDGLITIPPLRSAIPLKAIIIRERGPIRYSLAFMIGKRI